MTHSCLQKLILFHSFSPFVGLSPPLVVEHFGTFILKEPVMSQIISHNDLLISKLQHTAPSSRFFFSFFFLFSVFALLCLSQSLSQEEIARRGQLFSHLSAAL